MSAESERKVREWLINHHRGTFIVADEVEGTHIESGEKVRADLLLRPSEWTKQQTDCGDFLIAVEIKDPTPSSSSNDNDSMKRAFNAIAQASSYAKASFGGQVPDFVAIYPPLCDFASKYKYPVDRQSLLFIRMLMQRFNVGEMHVDKEDILALHTEFRFVGNRWFSPMKGMTRTKNLGTKRKIGSKSIVHNQD